VRYGADTRGARPMQAPPTKNGTINTAATLKPATPTHTRGA
jgi:hypothetical protein